MKILKFGGTSVGNVERIRGVADLCARSGRNIVVLSAMAGTTNALVRIADSLKAKDIRSAEEELSKLVQRYRTVVSELFADETIRLLVSELIELKFKEVAEQFHLPAKDVREKEILAVGELISTTLMLYYMRSVGIRARILPALDFMRTRTGGDPDITFISSTLRKMLAADENVDIWITQGYICRNNKGEVDNLKRGGSDYTATIIGAALKAREIQIWTDIDGMHNGDPRYVSDTRPVSRLHYDEAAELAYFGAKILHPACIIPAKLLGIPVRLLNTMEPTAPGTLISNFRPDGTIKAVAARDDMAVVTIRSTRQLPAAAFYKFVFEAIEDSKIVSDLMASSDVNVIIATDESEKIEKLRDRLKENADLTVDGDMTVICVAGDFIWSNGNDYASRVLDALRRVPVRMISYGASGYSICVAVRAEDKVRALNLLNERLF